MHAVLSNDSLCREEDGHMNLKLRIICAQPPSPEDHGALFGLQETTKAGRELYPGEVRANGDHVFTCECEVRRNPKTHAPDFFGPCVHGTPTDRFLYLTWLPVEGHPGMPNPIGPFGHRRMKIPLASLTWEQIAEAERTDGVLEAAVAGTAPDGGIRSGTVPLTGAGWAARAA